MKKIPSIIEQRVAFIEKATEAKLVFSHVEEAEDFDLPGDHYVYSIEGIPEVFVEIYKEDNVAAFTYDSTVVVIDKHGNISFDNEYLVMGESDIDLSSNTIYNYTIDRLAQIENAYNNY